jgi:hypothetical protein
MLKIMSNNNEFNKRTIMKTTLRFFAIIAFTLTCCCHLLVDSQPGSGRQQTTDQPTKQNTPRNIAGFFPFENNSNSWNYTESGGNRVTIMVTDTISDDGVTYFRVSFRENRVDTTDDWFMRSSKGVYFGQSLTGNYDLFLPLKTDSISGTFISAKLTVSYHCYDSLIVNGSMFYNVLTLHYKCPIIHGFDSITLADSIGIVQLIDDTARWPISYAIDSCVVGGTVRTF